VLTLHNGQRPRCLPTVVICRGADLFRGTLRQLDELISLSSRPIEDLDGDPESIVRI
jgi:hypothetical protein